MNRNNKLKASISTSLIAKVTTLLLQLTSLPMVAEKFGAEGLVFYSVLLSINSWLMLSTAGISPAMIIKISGSSSSDTARVWITNGMALFLVIGLFVSSIMIIFINIIDVKNLLLLGLGSENLFAGIFIVFILFMSQCICLPVDAIVLSFQKQYLSSLAICIGSMVSIITLIFFRDYIDSVPIFLLVVILPALIMKYITGLLFTIKESLFLVGLIDASIIKELFLSALEYTKSSTLVNFILNVLPVIILAKFSSIEWSSQYSSLNSLILLCSGLFSIISLPLIPALRESLIKGEKTWFESSVKKLKYYGLLLIIASLIIGSTIAEYLVTWYFSYKIDFSYFYVFSASLYFSSLIWSNMFFCILTAKDEINKISNIFLIKAIISILVLVLVLYFQLEINPFIVFFMCFLIVELPSSLKLDKV